MCLKGVGSTGWIGKTPPVHSREPYETWNGCRIDSLATQIKNPLKAGSNTKGKSDGGSRNGPKVEGLEHLTGIEPVYSGWKPDVITKLRQMQSGSGLSRMGFNVSCSTSLPKSPDRIAETTKPKGVSLGLLIYFAAQFALTSRAYHNSSTFRATIQVKSVAICAKCVTHWCVKHRFCKI